MELRNRRGGRDVRVGLVGCGGIGAGYVKVSEQNEKNENILVIGEVSRVIIKIRG